MKKICIPIALLFCFGIAKAQTPGGEWSVGPRFGGNSGASLKKYSSNNRQAFELIAAHSFDDNVRGFTTTVLYEKLAHLSETGRLSALIGGGATVNFGNVSRVGLTGIIGFDWRLKKAPINLQFDWAPTWFIINGTYFSGVNGAFTVRYILNQKKAIRK